MKSVNQNYNTHIITSYNLLKKHRLLIKSLISSIDDQSEIGKKDRFNYLLIMINKLDNVDLINLLNNTYTLENIDILSNLIVNDSSRKFEDEMFVLTYLLCIGLIK